MNRRLFVASPALAALVALHLAGFAAAEEFAPFKGALKGTVTRSDPPPPIEVNIAGAGTATQLGSFLVAIPHVVVPPNGRGFYYFEAANGDTLDAEFVGVSEPVDPGFLYIVEWAAITGGTGRFAGAKGSFVVERLYDIAAGTTVGYFEGTISAPGVNLP